jgi:hypothetical protein
VGPWAMEAARAKSSCPGAAGLAAQGSRAFRHLNDPRSEAHRRCSVVRVTTGSFQFKCVALQKP